MKKYTVQKDMTFKNDVIFIDGLWGTGKSIIAPVISGMKGVEKQKSEYIYEYLCILLHLKKIEPDAAITLLKMYADISQYNNCIGREVNLRMNDDSGFLNNPGTFKYFKRLFGKEGDDVVDNINDNNLALTIMSHMILPVSKPLFSAYGERLKIIEVVRHPLYMAKHWYNFLIRFTDSRIFTLSSNYDDVKVPWFAHEWDAEYSSQTLMNRVLSSIIFMYEWLFVELDKRMKQHSNIMTVSFENFVINPYPILDELEFFLDRKHFVNVANILKKQKIPRNQLTQGKGHTCYGWEKSGFNSENEEYANNLDYVRQRASENNLLKFNTLISKYNEKWPSILNQFH